MKVFVSIFFGAAVILTAYSNVGAYKGSGAFHIDGTQKMSSMI